MPTWMKGAHVPCRTLFRASHGLWKVRSFGPWSTRPFYQTVIVIYRNNRVDIKIRNVIIIYFVKKDEGLSMPKSLFLSNAHGAYGARSCRSSVQDKASKISQGMCRENKMQNKAFQEKQVTGYFFVQIMQVILHYSTIY